MQLPINVNHEQIAAFCRKHNIIKLAFFGSVLTDRFGPDSDVDVLVEFDPQHVPGLLAFTGMGFELSEILGREVHLHTPNSLSCYMRDRIVAEAVTQYAA